MDEHWSPTGKDDPKVRTRERILDGAMEAIARHGLSKLEMRDISRHAGVSRGTLYRYFSSREELLRRLSYREGRRFQEGLVAALRSAQPGPERIVSVVRFTTAYLGEHPVLQRLLESDPGFVLRFLREEFPNIRRSLHRLLAPSLEDTPIARGGLLGIDALVDFSSRLLISAYLLPGSDPDELVRGLPEIYRVLALEPDESAETG